MNFDLTPEEKRLEDEVHRFLKENVTDEIRDEAFSPECTGPHYLAMLRKMAEKGWLAITWPKQYGGLEGSQAAKYAVRNELNYHLGGWTLPRTGCVVAGPTIMLHGSEEQKNKWLLPISQLEIDFALGYTEPGAGSDLASAQIRAEESGDFYVINGQKTFSGTAHYSDYHWLLARTLDKGPKHRGLSLFMVDLKSPGVTVRPLWCIDGHRVNEVFYDNVRVPRTNMVGDKNQGWYIVATALDFERQFPIGQIRVLLDRLIDYVNETSVDGKRLAEDILVMQKIADREVEFEVLWLLAYRVAWMTDKEMVPNYEASMAKVFGTELHQRLTETAMDILGMYNQLPADSKCSRRLGEVGDSKCAQLKGEVMESYLEARRQTIVGGASEIQRNIIATRGLGLPRQ